MLDAKNLLNSVNADGLIGKMLGGMATKNFAAGLLSGGLATSLLGGGKNTVETAAQVGGLALLGTLAYKAYGNYKQQQQTGGSGSVVSAVSQSAQSMVSQGQSLLSGLLGSDTQPDQATTPQASPEFGLAVLRAMIGAAKADGHMDAQEMEKVMGQMQAAQITEAEKMLVMQEMANTPNVNAIASAAQTPEAGAQIYLAALLVCDSQCAQEVAYLESLAGALKLDSAFTQSLQRELVAASAAKAAA